MPIPSIRSFSGKYRFLSNFWADPAEPVLVGSQRALSLEHWYHAYKSLDPEIRAHVLSQPTPGAAKRAGRSLIIRDDWEQVKIPCMRYLLSCKFVSGSPLAQRLLATGDALLVEGNNWGDTFWGEHLGRGENWLGHLLMARRAEVRFETEKSVL